MRLRVKKIKPHLPYITVFLIIFLSVYGLYLNLNMIPALDPLTFYVAKLEMLRQSATKYHDIFPLWNPYTMGGQPYLGTPDNDQLTSLAGLLVLILQKPHYAFNIALLLNLFFAGIFMYVLVIYLTKSKKAAFISTLVYIFNPWLLFNVSAGGLTTLNVYVLIPLTILFMIKSFRKENWIFYSVITGIIFSLHIRFGTGLKVFLFVALLFAIYVIVYVIGRNFRKRVIKATIASLIIISITFGLSAQLILPEKEFLGMSSRKQHTWEQSAGGGLPVSQWFGAFIEPFYEGWPKIQRKPGGGNLGLVPFLLGCLAVYAYWRDKKVLSFSLGALLAVLIVSGSFVFYILWKYVPPFHSFRHTQRAVVLLAFTMSILAGYGFLALCSILKKKWKTITNKKMNIVFITVTGLIMINIILLGGSPYANELGDITNAIEKNYLMKEVAKDESIFRIHVYETNGIDWGTEFSYVPYGFSALYGSTGIWLTEWISEFLSAALYQPAKFWGIFNVKYVQSMSNISVDGLRFVKEFEKCGDCYETNPHIQKAFGNYLYENELFLPRAYFVDNSLLVVGQENPKKQTIYALMLNSKFNPSNTVIIKGKESINDYNADELKKYSAIVLTAGSIDQNSGYLLKSYVENGGRLLPNIIENKNSFTEEDINDMFDSFKGEINPVEDDDYITHKFGRYEVRLDGGKKGFLVLSEKFSSFPGWKALANGKELEIMKVDGMITSVYVDNYYDSVVLEYKPMSYVIGSSITIMTLLLLIIYFGRHYYNRKIKKKQGIDYGKA